MINNKVKVGYVAIIGLPNAGKSTLMNALLGQKLAITNQKPQTTRKRILGILSEENYQVIFLDTPGILNPSYLLQEKMIEDVELSVRDADVFVIIIDVSDEKEIKKALMNDFLKEIYENKNHPKLLVLNKVDLLNQDKVNDLIGKFEEMRKFNSVIPISASLDFNIQRVLSEIIDHLPEGEKFYPDDIIAEADERFFVSEIIREKILELYEDEIPYSCEVLIVEFKERENAKDFIGAEIFVEKETQKPIIIGNQGRAIKKLGEKSRAAIEKFLQREVYLELRVKVRDKWRSNERMLKSFGYGRGKDKK
ncbi:MAG: GTPase Era [Ignavibacteriaceae bacterium]|nr:GTPase Era [Ignavibacteriaceae bacterium]